MNRSTINGTIAVAEECIRKMQFRIEELEFFKPTASSAELTSLKITAKTLILKCKKLISMLPK